MAPSTLDLVILTFNCAKALIDVPVFAGHLADTLAQEGTALPDVVVFSLQEVAPLSYSFVGGYFLNSYFSRFEEALNLAASQISPNDKTQPPQPYTLVTARNVGYTAIAVLARDPASLTDVREAEVGFGAAEMGNKGAVGVRALYREPGPDAQETELTFVATHLAAMEWNLARRNANWAAIMRGMAFDDPEAAVKRQQQHSSEPSPLLGPEQSWEDHRRELHDLSVFKPSSHLFVAGDLNYRISTTPPPPDAAFPDMDPTSATHHSRFRPRDQLDRERAAGRTLHGLSEAPVAFPPTYKYKVSPPEAGQTEPTWRFARHRWPAWTDRVLYLDTPGSSPSTSPDAAGAAGAVAPRIRTRTYDALPVMMTSDHRPVLWRGDVPLLSRGHMRALVERAGTGVLTPSSESTGEDSPAAPAGPDPRARLPVEIDPEAWGRRAAARYKELVVGWATLLGSTREGAAVWASLAALTAAWWYYVSLTAEPHQV